MATRTDCEARCWAEEAQDCADMEALDAHGIDPLAWVNALIAGQPDPLPQVAPCVCDCHLMFGEGRVCQEP